MDIIDKVYAVMGMFRIFIVFLAAFYFIPALVVKGDKDAVERRDFFFPVFFKGTLIIMLAIHFASVSNMMDSFAMIMLTIITLVVVRYLGRKKNQSFELSLVDRTIIYILDLSDSGMTFNAQVLFLMNAFLSGFKKIIGNVYAKIKQEPVLYLLNGVTFGYAVIVRAVHPVNHYYLASSDAYLHLVWTKYINLNGLYQDGVYPEGMHTAFAYLGALFNIDMYYIFRYMGPIIGLLIIFSIYHFVKQHLSVNAYTPWFATSVYVFVTTYPSQAWRQISALPQEFAIIFMLPTLHFLICYVENGNKKNLLLYSTGLAIAFLVHFYSGFYVIVASFFYIGLRLLKIMKEKRFLPLLIAGVGGVFAGFIPMLLAIIAGYPLHPSFDFLKRSIASAGEDLNRTDALQPLQAMNLEELIQSDWMLLLAVSGAVLLILWSLFGQRKFIYGILLSAFMTVFLYIQYQAAFFQVPSLMLKDRTGVFLAIFASIAAGTTLGALLALLQSKSNNKIIEGGLSLAFMILLLVSFDPQIPEGVQYEYDQSAKAYVTITQDIPKNTMTIVGVQEQYQQIYGKGYHYQLWQFISEQSDQSVSKIEIPTENVFIFTEKMPFGGKEPVNKQVAMQTIPKLSGDLTLYYNEYRATLESKIYFWAESFMKAYPENTKVYYEDDLVKIYWIKQNPLDPINLKTGEPKEVFAK